MGYTPHVLVVGGGSTGTGVARDLAMRGLEVTLVERGPLAGGTSGSMHALLHSGARYAVDDGETAATCSRESQILREIGGHLVTETGGLYASLAVDPDGYVETKRTACEDAGIPVASISGDEARRREPTLADDVEGALAVPDAVIDPFGLRVANARSATRHGAEIRTGWLVVDVTVADGAIDSVRLRNEDPAAPMLSGAGSDLLEPDYVVNAAGPWAGEVAGMAGLDVPIRHTRGATLVTERAGLDMVVNRCRPPAQGDVAVPFGSTSILGTTDRDVDGPDDGERASDEVDLLVDELAELVPSVAGGRLYRADWSVRALPAEEQTDSSAVSRPFALVDHEARDDCWGMSTVFGGPPTIHRHVAERVADHVCAKFGIDRPCRTADVELPVDESADDVPGLDGDLGPNPTLCESEGVTRRAVEAVLEDAELPPGADLRPVVHRTGAATGACQGGRCAHRLAGELYPEVAARAVDRTLEEFLAERWDGLRFACWGDGLATAARTYELHASTMNRDGLPGPNDEEIEFAAFDAGLPPSGGAERGGDRHD